MGSETPWPSVETHDNAGKLAPAAGIASANPASQMDAPPQSSGPPPFLIKTYEMVEDSATDAIVSWSEVGNSFVVWNPPEFAQDLLPKYFKHNNFSSFVRQLNTYGFRKVDPDRWEFANEGFMRGKRDMLRSIRRRKPAVHAQQQGSCVEVGKFGLEGEIERLKRDKNVLMLELVKLRQQQQSTERELQVMTQRFHVSEHRQQRMISFLTKAMQNPSFFAQFVSQQNENNEVVRKKRRLPIHEYGDMHESMSPESSIENQMVAFQPSELGEAGARARVIEMFRSSDSQPATESSHFEGLAREADTSPNSGDSNMLNRQPRATLEELNTKLPGIFSSAPIVTDVSANESLEAPPTSPQTFDMARVLSGSRSERRDSGDSHEREGNRGTATHEAEVQSARTDTAAHNSGFWEQFLTEDPQPVTRAEIDLEREPESETEDTPQDDENALRNSFDRPCVEFLSHQMGQLAPG